MTTEYKRCYLCKCWQPDSDKIRIDWPSLSIGYCRCNPPIFIYQGMGQFPQTRGNEWCETGFKKRESDDTK